MLYATDIIHIEIYLEHTYIWYIIVYNKLYLNTDVMSLNQALYFYSHI